MEEEPGGLQSVGSQGQTQLVWSFYVCSFMSDSLQSRGL